MNWPDGDITFADAKTVTGLKLSIDYQQNPVAGSQITNIDASEVLCQPRYVGTPVPRGEGYFPAGGLTKLRSLALGGNPVKDIAVIADMKELDYLALFNCEASDYSPLKNLTKLRVLQIGYSTFSETSVLQGLTNLSELDLANTQVTDVAPLASLTKLKSLKLSGCAITDYKPIKSIYANLQDKDFQP
jgi:internalin A